MLKCESARKSSVSADSFSLVADTVVVYEDNLNVVTSVDVTLGNRVDDVLACVLCLLFVCLQHFHLEVMANELVVEDWTTELHT